MMHMERHEYRMRGRRRAGSIPRIRLLPWPPLIEHGQSKCDSDLSTVRRHGRTTNAQDIWVVHHLLAGSMPLARMTAIAFGVRSKLTGALAAATRPMR